MADKQIVYVLTDRGPERRDVALGPSNQSYVEIKSGIQAGELVVMNARSQFSDQLAQLEAELNLHKAKNTMIEVIPPAPTEPAGPKPGGSGVGPGSGGGGRPDRGAMFTQLDKNSDGKLTVDEMSEGMQDRFPAMDKDGDGSVTKDEFLSAPRPPRGGDPEGTGGPRPN